MNAERLLEVYEQISEAPDAIARLRRFVLGLAMHGKLVEQDSGDEPASVLLNQIAAEKARLIKSGEIRKPRELTNGEELEPPFEIPVSWQWCRLDVIGAIIGGGTPSAGDPNNFSKPGEGIPWLTPADLGGYRDLSISRGARDLTEKGLASSSATMMPSGTVLFTSRAPIGYVAIAANPISTNQGFKSIVPYVAECSRFIALAMRTFAPEIDARAPGTTFKEVSGKIVAGVAFPLPPLPEQHRIVAKVDELMALCDRLEEARKTREETRDKLTTASLARLTAPDTMPEDFPAHAAFALDALPALTTRPDQIKTLRQTILNLAVRGKLVEQNPADEPASDLLEKAKEDIAEYGQANGVRPAKVDKIRGFPFDVPFGWAWTRLASIFRVVTDGDHQPPPRSDAGVAFLTIGNVSGGTLEFDGCRRVPQEYFDALPRYRTPSAGDLLYTVVGATFGRPVVVDDHEPFCVQRHIAILKPSSEMSLPFLGLLMASPFVYSQAKEALTGAAQPTLTLRPLRNFMLPIPPLTEQHRIVAKVDALMALCNRLAAALTTTETTRTRLLEALLHEALEPEARALEAAE
ncbi:restriction endonuclease subunit S [Roseicyclus sp. F158]|uniref:Restriction endonuclease subunit S n=1 Tax=Tropicimonas omnivorans TaxID=3075590 RepID=A0ABU3DIZ9_9RHOB|nr:restriction endonuclease subunit S [Roseicyclus sp. F158]MDT0683082.1 restriction endonuclease subunit S [Roseicyclus sp. F158]